MESMHTNKDEVHRQERGVDMGKAKKHFRRSEVK